MKIYFDTNVGKIRKNNEDKFSVTSLADDTKLLIVADGVGGEEDGEVASYIATECIKKYISENIDYEKLPDSVYQRNLILAAMEFANASILKKQLDNDTKMKTTVVSALIYKNHLIVSNIGDSRCYIYNKKLYQITKDHTYVQSLVDAGIITEIEARVHNARHYVTRVLGSEEEMEIDFFEMILKEDDILILCSDGLNAMVEDNDICKIIENNDKDGEKIVKSLINAALNNGGIDNITIICAKDFKEQ